MRKLTQKPIRKISKSRSRKLAEYQKLKEEFLSNHKICQVCRESTIDGLLVPAVAWKPSVDVHHIRGRVGRLLCETRFWMAVCRSHHNLIHDIPSWAKARGYIKDWLKTDDL